MKHRFTITITDIYASKHYLVYKRVVMYIILTIFFLILAIIFFIFLQRYKINLEHHKKQFIQNRYNILKKESFYLKHMVKINIINHKKIKKEIDRLKELNAIVSTNSLGTLKKLKDINIARSQKKILLRFVPSGNVLPDMKISAKFGWRIHPILKRREFHAGIDLKADRETPIKAPADGVVEYVGYHKKSGFGYLIILDHNFGFKTQYGHLSKKTVVKRGQFIKKGDIIGYTGSSGLSTGPHLHYEVRFISIPLNPIYFLKWNRQNFNYIFKKEKLIPWQSLINAMSSQYPQQE